MYSSIATPNNKIPITPIEIINNSTNSSHHHDEMSVFESNDLQRHHKHQQNYEQQNGLFVPLTITQRVTTVDEVIDTQMRDKHPYCYEYDNNSQSCHHMHTLKDNEAATTLSHMPAQ
uniref:ATP-dependent dethiobiotin synthetase BioD n=1 Tax=Lygus hesperus TaxID=30085 RepID=A0A0A9XPV2_LYGHE